MDTRVQLSYWERESYFEDIDLLIVGGGIVGLNAALNVKELQPDLRVLVIDRGLFLPYGASTRNAGFCCFGSMTELLDDLQTTSREAVFELVDKRYRGLVRLREMLKEEDIGYEPLGGFEVFTESDQKAFGECKDRMEDFNVELKKITGSNSTYSVVDDSITQFGFSGVQHLIKNSGEGQLNTGKLMKALLRKVRSAGVEVLTGIEIMNWTSGAEGLIFDTAQGFTFKSRKMLVTTNAFARQLLPALEVVPGRAQVLITSPVDGLKVNGAFHYEKGYYYFRNVGDRILFGGGRNLDFKTEETTQFDLTDTVQNRLDEILKTMILPGQSYTIEQRWSGIMGLGPVKSAIVEKINDTVFCAVRMGGMGVAIGSLIGREVAELITSRK
jgi:gamma-glutamylputrescine oxidase